MVGSYSQTTYDNSSSSSSGYSENGLTTGTFTSSGGQWTNGQGTQDHGTPDPSLPNNPDYTGIQPIILDLDPEPDGIEIEVGGTTYFDWDDDGFKEAGNWASADDGFLVIDLDENGNIGSGD
ncbi:MAG: hypothetical protein ABJP33_03285, partial [Pseudoruegeria sp.]